MDEEVQQEIEGVKEQVIATTTRDAYLNSQAQLVSFLVSKFPEAVDLDVLAKLADQTQTTREIIKLKLQRKENLLDVNHFNEEMFLSFIVTLRKRNGEKPGFAALAVHRSALQNIFSQSKTELSPQVQQGLMTFFKGLRRSRLIDGSTNARSGKEPLEFELFRFLGFQLLRSGRKQHSFAHLFLTLSWNLMSRASNTVKIMYDHLSWKQDALQVVFLQQKNDQFGDKPKDGKSVFSNILMPEIDVMFSLGVYFVSFGFDESGRLFSGKNQYERYRKILGEVFHELVVATELERRGLKPEDLGSHSTRKGAATFVSGGSTACPSASAIHLRAGWALGGVEKRYIRFEKAGDAHVRRAVCGLPSASSQFGALPAHFPASTPQVATALNLVFHQHPQKLRFILERCLASLVKNRDWALEHMDKKSRLFTCALFTDDDLYRSLKSQVRFGESHPEDSLQPTGIPPHVAILKQFEDVKSALVSLPDCIKENRSQCVTELLEELEMRALGSNTVTYHGLRETIRRVLEESGIQESIQALRPGVETARPVQQVSQQQMYMWNGRFRKIPENFNIPECSLKQAWVLWNHGNKDICSFKKLTGSDFGTRTQQKRFCELKFMMTSLENQCRSFGLRCESEAETLSAFHQINQGLVSEKRSWATEARLLRKRKQGANQSS